LEILHGKATPQQTVAIFAPGGNKARILGRVIGLSATPSRKPKGHI